MELYRVAISVRYEKQQGSDTSFASCCEGAPALTSHIPEPVADLRQAEWNVCDDDIHLSVWDDSDGQQDHLGGRYPVPTTTTNSLTGGLILSCKL